MSEDLTRTFFGLHADEWEAAANAMEWPVCPWNGERLTDQDMRLGITAMLRLESGDT